eukprot:795105-Rhodomonas_salina.1
MITVQPSCRSKEDTCGTINSGSTSRNSYEKQEMPLLGIPSSGTRVPGYKWMNQCVAFAHVEMGFFSEP